jgi:hypothetical protein
VISGFDETALGQLMLCTTYCRPPIVDKLLQRRIIARGRTRAAIKAVANGR